MRQGKLPRDAAVGGSKSAETLGPFEGLGVPLRRSIRVTIWDL